MAEQIPFRVASSLITKLASLAFHEIRQISGAMEDLDKLKDTITTINEVLSDAEKKQEQQKAVENWIRRFKEVLHTADDLLIEDLRRKRDGNEKSKVHDFLSSSNRFFFRYKVAHKIKEIRKQMDNVAKDMSVLKLIQGTDQVIQNKRIVWRETSSFVLESDIIGREESKMEIVSLLKETHSNQNVSMVAIVGIGGLGKTALTQLVYNDACVQEFFQKRIWVCVSEDFETKTLLTKMLKSLAITIVGDRELDQLQQKLQESLNGRKYLIVLDDVWNESKLKWDDMRTYLMCGAQGSKILVTTRSEIVAQTMGVNNTYVLKGLTKEQSWDLLKKVVFGEDFQNMTQSLLSIGEKIAERCGGVPLAIKTIGGLLQSQNEEKQWSNILNGDFWRSCEDKVSIMPALKLSYQNLPIELRQCFAYCALYPKDWDIEKDDLILLWMAQGYLQCSTANESMEDLGDRYIKTLLMRSFFQDAIIDDCGDIWSFKMHDLMHDLAMSIAGNDCHIENEGKGNVGRAMHVSFETSKGVPSLKSHDPKRLRTILELVPDYIYGQSHYIIKELHDISNFKSLRVLRLSNSIGTKLPESIGQLKHLKLLDLRECRELTKLPKSIGNLVGLEALKLGWCQKLKFPTQEIIPRLISLRHLDIYGCKAFENMMPAGLGKLSSLQYLSDFVVGEASEKNCGKLNELKDLNNLRGQVIIKNLRFDRDVVSEAAEANLKEKRHLRSLKLRWADGNNNDSDGNLQLLENLRPNQNLKKLDVVDYSGEKFSRWLSSLENIVSLSLERFPKCQHLPPLERLPWLKTLEIYEMDSLECIYYESNDDTTMIFQSLEILSLINCPKLRGWQRMRHVKDNTSDVEHQLPSFPRLSRLHICNCSELTSMPTYPHLNEGAVLISCNLKPLIETLSLIQSSSSHAPLSQLKSLHIQNISIGGVLPDEWMRNLISLQTLTLSKLPSLAPLFRHMRPLPAALQQLTISTVEQLDVKEDDENEDVGTPIQPLHCLHSLQSIEIKFCNNLIALPEWICDLSSLQHFQVEFCGNLESLPEGLSRLTNLQMLSVNKCTPLRERCKRNTGADWHKIAHISDIRVDDNKV